MSPEVAEQMEQLPEVFDATDVLRAVAAGVRRGGHLAITPAELDEIAAELGGPPWPM